MRLVAVRDEFLKVLSKAQEERDKRTERIDDEPAWVHYERHVMLKVVNRYRVRRGNSPVDIWDIMRVERQAEGHSDYSSKFALYCAEIAINPKGAEW